jgi:Ser/Thr protein kinase RdoA (MazF antagonist)
VNRSRDRYWLFLERVDGLPLNQIGSTAAWESACRWAARLHASGQGVSNPRLLRYDRAFYEIWGRRVRRFAETASPRRRTRMRWLVEKYRHAIDLLLASPRTLIHGELYPANVVTRGRRICVLDWETAGIGPGVIDLAALTTGDWRSARRDAMVSAYCDTCPRALRPDDVDRALGCARIALAMRWLGWSTRWRPPRRHRRDWLAEGIEIAEKLKL